MYDKDEVRTYTVYSVTKKVPDENYDMYVGLSDNISIERDLKIFKFQSRHIPLNFYNRMQKVGVRNWEITPLFRKECSYNEISQYRDRYIEMLQPDITKDWEEKEEVKENREKIKKYQQKYYQENKKHKQKYYQENREKIEKYNQEYRRKNRENKEKLKSNNSLDQPTS